MLLVQTFKVTLILVDQVELESERRRRFVNLLIVEMNQLRLVILASIECGLKYALVETNHDIIKNSYFDEIVQVQLNSFLRRWRRRFFIYLR
jgi:hypothetical protein